MPAAIRVFLISLFTLFTACSDTSFQLSLNFPGVLEVTVHDATDNTPIRGAAITVVNADTQANVAWLLSDTHGRASINLESGSYYVRISAQGFLPTPPSGQDGIAFQILNNLTTSKVYRLSADPNAVNSGQLHGRIATPSGLGIPGVLVVAKDGAQGITLSSISTNDGVYRLFNVPPGDYAVEGLIGGYQQLSAPGSVNIPPSTIVSGIDRTLERAVNAALSGKVSFLAVVNGIVDITLLHPDTLDPIPGLNAFNDAGGNTYLITGVPLGDYIAWASYRNDGYVMDPDSIRKFGLPSVTFTSGGGNRQQDFSVTGAITLIAPSNPPKLIIPQIVSTSQPLFQWEPYPSAKEYIIEVRDAQGQVIWGGYNAAGNILHSPITAGTSAILFNFDGSAGTPLIAGETYRWKIFADNDAAVDIQGLISAGEQQMGLFHYQP